MPPADTNGIIRWGADTLTWKGAVSMASPEVPPHCKQAFGSLPGTGPGWENTALRVGGYNTARALVH